MKTALVIKENKLNYIISEGGNELTATVRGSFFVEKNFPKVGDQVTFTLVSEDKAVIEEILPRTSVIARKNVGTGAVQVLVANVDLIFIVMGLDNDFNLSRLERYLLLAKQSEVRAVVVLNKSDEVEDISEYTDQAKSISGNTPVHAVSALNNQNMNELIPYLTTDTTAVLLGSSGAGKSTITNWLLNEDTQKVSGVREDDSRGRHTTTSRELFVLSSGAHLIDTPGIRELGILDSSTEDEDIIFSKIYELSKQCEFTKCDHKKSKGCAILKAIEDEDISERQFRSYQKLQEERVLEKNKHKEKLPGGQKEKKFYKRPKNALQKKHFDKEF